MKAKIEVEIIFNGLYCNGPGTGEECSLFHSPYSEGYSAECDIAIENNKHLRTIWADEEPYNRYKAVRCPECLESVNKNIFEQNRAI